MPPSPVSMADIARAAGVSPSTVSKCLGDKRDVSAATRERVLALCQKLGYKSNPLVSALMRTRRRRIASADAVLPLAFVTAFPSSDAWRRHPSPTFRQMHAGAARRAAERGYRLEHFWLHRDGMSNRRFGEMLRARGIPGLLLAPVPDAAIEIDLDWNPFSVVALGLTPSTRRFHRVSTDYYQGMLLALEECARLGYSRPGLAVRRVTNDRLERRWEAAFELGRPPRSSPSVLVAKEWDAPTVERWLDREKPDVVIGQVFGPLETILRASGRRIPEDIGMVGLFVPEPKASLSGIVQDGQRLGALAVDQLVGQIERNETGLPPHPVTHTTPVQWNPGSTTRPVSLPARG